ncbi:flagellar biosynthesis protein FlhG [Cupriavidus gilardii]|nr:flagellar biosynthesis protein FlhG [Cupriavidus gilardii]MCG5261866.1 flagellar biosynthesis protein FlhG [Cupriavidus gilardii]MDF9429812.1 flagellar biosynthesis protein FlhG [Cupriavidus gilardii]
MLAVDQAESLRRMLAPRATRRIAVLACEPGAGATTVALGLAHALAMQGEHVLLVDEDLSHARATRLAGASPAGTLAQVLGGAIAVDAALGRREPGMPALLPGDPLAWGPLQALQGFRTVVSDARVGADGALSRFSGAAHNLVVVMRPERQSLTAAYACIKRLHHRYACRQFELVVNGAASEASAIAIAGNLARTAGQYLGVQARCAGVLPADPLVARSTALARGVVDAFPGAPATAMLRRLAASIAGWPLPSDPEPMPATGAATAARHASASAVPPASAMAC